MSIIASDNTGVFVTRTNILVMNCFYLSHITIVGHSLELKKIVLHKRGRQKR